MNTSNKSEAPRAPVDTNKWERDGRVEAGSGTNDSETTNRNNERTTTHYFRLGSSGQQQEHASQIAESRIIGSHHRHPVISDHTLAQQQQQTNKNHGAEGGTGTIYDSALSGGGAGHRCVRCSQRPCPVMCQGCDKGLCMNCASILSNTAMVMDSGDDASSPKPVTLSLFWNCKGCGDSYCKECRARNVQIQQQSGAADGQSVVVVQENYCEACSQSCPCASSFYSADCRICKRNFCSRCEDWFIKCQVCETTVCRDCDSSTNPALNTCSMFYCQVCERELCTDCRQQAGFCEGCENYCCNQCFSSRVSFCHCDIPIYSNDGRNNS